MLVGGCVVCSRCAVVAVCPGLLLCIHRVGRRVGFVALVGQQLSEGVFLAQQSPGAVVVDKLSPLVGNLRGSCKSGRIVDTFEDLQGCQTRGTSSGSSLK